MEKEIDDILMKYDGPSVPGASVLVMKNDRTVFQKSYGLANIETGEKLTDSSNFRLASVTKQFTAMTILMLSRQGRLSLDDSLHDHFPDFPAYGKAIRIRHLLTHTSGLMDYEDLIQKTLSRQVHDTDCLQLMNETDSLYFPPGSRYRYSNTGYALLSLITEKVSGRPFAGFLRDSIFAPLGMKTSVAFEEGVSNIANRSFGHSLRDGKWVQTDQSQTSAVLGDGGIYSNPNELALWISALWNHRLIDADLQREAWTRASLNDSSRIDYGYGWHIEGPDDHPHHDGSTMGFHNHILVYPDKKMMVVILTNRNEGDPRSEAEKIAALF